jgi:hypothetical protein
MLFRFLGVALVFSEPHATGSTRLLSRVRREGGRTAATLGTTDGVPVATVRPASGIHMLCMHLIGLSTDIINVSLSDARFR